MPKQLNSQDEVEVRSRAELRSWLGRNEMRKSGIWLVHYKKASPDYLPMDEIVAECIAHGWIDSKMRRKDALRVMHWIAPRDPNSNWSAVNKRIVADLVVQGLMTPNGSNSVEIAKSNGSWTRLDAAERLEVPQDLDAAFSELPGSRQNWDKFSASSRRGMLGWVLSAKRDDTRKKRITEIAMNAERNERSGQWR